MERLKICQRGNAVEETVDIRICTIRSVLAGRLEMRERMSFSEHRRGTELAELEKPWYNYYVPLI